MFEADLYSFYIYNELLMEHEKEIIKVLDYEEVSENCLNKTV